MFYNVDAELVKGKNRKEHLVKARKLFCLLAREYSNESFEKKLKPVCHGLSRVVSDLLCNHHS